MKKRLLYILLPFILAFSALSVLIPAPVVDAAATGLSADASNFCKSDSKVVNENDCEQGYQQGFQGYLNNKNDASSYCGKFEIINPGRGGPVSTIGVTSCTEGYNQSYSEGAGLEFCSDYGPSIQAGCLKVYDDGKASSTDNSTNYCQSPPDNLKQATCVAMYKAGNTAQTNNNNVANNNGGASNATCESSGAFLSLSWMVCPIVNIVADTAQGIYNGFIQPLLYVNPIATSSSSTNHIYGVWSQFRLYGDIVLVLMVLIVVFGESIGGGLVDAYTAKKVLPRLLVAAVLINLSIYLVAIAVDVSNILGRGIEALIEQPFKSAGTFHISLDPASSATLGIGELLGASGAIWAIIATHGSIIIDALGLVGAVFVIPALLTLLAIMITLILRQGLILFLIFISPVAFALYCLPNTEKYFRKWWELLSKTLLIYPIVGVLFAMGNVLSVSMGLLFTGLDHYIASFLEIVVLFIPLVLIPYAFRFSGGIIGEAHGAIMGVRDRAHKMGEGRRQKAKEKFGRDVATARAKGYESFGQTGVGRAVNNTWGIGGVMRRRAHAAEQLESIHAAQIAQDEHLKPVANDEYALRSAMEARSYGEAISILQSRHGLSLQDAKDAANRWKATGLGWGGGARMAAFQAAVADGTVFKDKRDHDQAIVDIAGQNEALRDRIWGQAYVGNKAAGRFDLSPSYGTGKQLLDRLAGGEQVSLEDYDAATVEGLRTASNTQLSQTKGVGMEDGMDAMSRHISNQRRIIDDPATTDEARQAARVALTESIVKLRNMRDAGMYMPEGLLNIVNNRASITTATTGETGTTTVRSRADGEVDLHGDPIPEHRRNADNRVILDENNNPVPVIERTENPDLDPATLAAQRQTMRGVDPRNPGGPLDPNGP